MLGKNLPEHVTCGSQGMVSKKVQTGEERKSSTIKTRRWKDATVEPCQNQRQTADFI